MNKPNPIAVIAVVVVSVFGILDVPSAVAARPCERDAGDCRSQDAMKQQGNGIRPDGGTKSDRPEKDPNLFPPLPPPPPSRDWEPKQKKWN